MKLYRTIRLIITLVLIVTGIGAQGQNINFVMNSHPSPYLSDWQIHRETAIVIVTNTTGKSINAKISYQIYNGKGEMIAETDLGKMPVISCEPGSSQFYAEDIFPPADVKYHGHYDTKAATMTGRIPDDNYRICVQLVNPTTLTALTTQQPQCSNFTIIAYEPPSLISPRDGEPCVASQTRRPLFQWTPLQPAYTGGIVTYRLQVMEVLPGQEKGQAYRTNKPILEKDYKNLITASWPIDYTLPDTGMSYVWSVTALDEQDRPLGSNEGRSGYFTFKCIGNNNASGPGNDTNSTTNHNHHHHSNTNSGTQDSIAKGDTIYAGEGGEFLIITDSVSKGTANGTFDGTGKVHIGWLKADISVQFSGITLNSDTLKTGSIQAVIDSNAAKYPKAWAEQVAANYVLSNHTVSSVVDWVDSVADATNQTLPSYASSMTYTAPFDLPLGFNISTGNEFAITEMEFLPAEADINIIASKTVTIKGAKDTLGFLGTDIKIHPKKIDFSSGTLELVADIPVKLNDKVMLTFKKPSSTSSPIDGWFLQWDTTGISKINMEIDAEFTRDWLVPNPDDGTSKVTAVFMGNATSFSDIMITGTLPECQIVNSAGSNSGVIIEGGTGFTIDLSDIRNPDSIKFPQGYAGDTTVTWQGFSMQTMNIDLPSSWKKPDGDTIKVAVDTFLIDNQGITMHASATNVADFNNASVAKMSATIDTVVVMILASSLTDASIKGRVILPVTRDTVNNPLKYVAIYAQPSGAGTNDYFQITIDPTGPIDADMLNGKMTLDETSAIFAHVEKDKDSFSLKLNGSFKWDNITLGPIKNVKMDLEFEGLGLTKSPAGSFKFEIGTWGFASPPKFLAHLPVTITDIGFTPMLTGLDASQGELIKGSVDFKVIANLSAEVGGATKLGVIVGFGKKPGESYKPIYHDTKIDSINVHADLSAVSIDGGIGFFHDNATYGNGFLGNISVVFKAAELKLDALVQFGTTVDAPTNTTYRYWRAEALLTLPPPGVVFMSGLAFRGFGGGAYQNMYPTLENGGFTFKPQKGNLGFEAKAVIATTPKDEAFNMDVTMLGNFSSSGGLTYLGFGGQFYVGAGIDDRAKAMIKGSLNVDYDFTTKIFDLSAQATVDAEEGGVKILYTPPGESIGLVLHVDGSTNKWYFKSGTPTQTNTIDVLGISLYSYLMMGNDLGGDVPNGFTHKFSDPYNSLFPGSLPSLNPSDGGASLTATGKGFALGVGISFSHSTTDEVYNGTFRVWSVNTYFGAGAELDLALLQYNGSCNGSNPVGIRGYRASGGLGFYAAASASLDGISKYHSAFCCDDKHYNLCNIKGGAWITGAFPNPVFAQGAIDGDIDALDDLVCFHFHKDFTYGTDCSSSGLTQDAGPAVAQQDQADSQARAMIKYVNPMAPYNFPDSNDIKVAYNLVPGDVFTIGEQQSDGSSKTRTFKMTVVTTLKPGGPASTSPAINLLFKTNNLGEYLYYVPPSANTSASLSASQGKVVSGINTWGSGSSGSGSTVGLGGGPSGSGTWSSGGSSGSAMGLGGGPSGSGTWSSGVSSGSGSSYGAFSGPSVSDTWSLSGSVPYPPVPTEMTVAPTPPPPKNNLEKDKTYTFTVIATLMELKGTVSAGQGKDNGSSAGGPTWQPAVTMTGAPLTQKIVRTFKTGPHYDNYSNSGTQVTGSGANVTNSTGQSGTATPSGKANKTR